MSYCKENQCPYCVFNKTAEFGGVECSALSDTRFGDRACPFMKTEKEMDEGAKRTYERLKSRGEDSLIRIYKLKPGYSRNSEIGLTDVWR